MGMYNKLAGTVRCPRCGEVVDADFELFFGLRDLTQYRIGDVYKWVPRREPQNGGRPNVSDPVGSAYAVCPKCEKDFFARVCLRGDVVASVEPDPDRVPYDPDRRLQGTDPCPRCHGSGELLVFRGYQVASFVCANPACDFFGWVQLGEPYELEYQPQIVTMRAERPAYKTVEARS